MSYRVTDLHFLGVLGASSTGVGAGATLINSQAFAPDDIRYTEPIKGITLAPVPKTDFTTGGGSGYVPQAVTLGPLYAQTPPVIAPLRATSTGTDTQTIAIASGIGLLALLLYLRS